VTRYGFVVIPLLLLPTLAPGTETEPVAAAAIAPGNGSGAQPMPYQPSEPAPPPAAGPGPGYGRGPMGMPGYRGPGYSGGGPGMPWSRTYYGRRLVGDPENTRATNVGGAAADYPEAGTGSIPPQAPAYGGPQAYGSEPWTPCDPQHPGYYGGPPGRPYGPGYYRREPARPAGPGFYRDEPGAGYVSGPKLRIERDTDADAYVVRIHTREDVDPATVDVQQRGRQLQIRVSRSNQTNYTDDQTAGYRSYSFAYSSHTSRRFTLPPDADLSAMQREDQDGSVTLTFPRNQGY
jgi:HSP20 family molecular chaperone IbpA